MLRLSSYVGYEHKQLGHRDERSLSMPTWQSCYAYSEEIKQCSLDSSSFYSDMGY